jgi:YidC/Oxa1 family membrane protein insertase
MINRKNMLYIMLAFSAVLLWNNWQHFQKMRTQKAATAVTTSSATTPVQVTTPPTPTAATTASPAVKQAEPTHVQAPKSRLITVTTDVLKVEIDKKGGNIIDARLLKYPAKINQPDNPFQLLTDASHDYYVASSGFVANNQAAKAHPLYTSDKSDYSLSPDAKTLTVRLTHKDNSGVLYTKTYVFSRDNYTVTLDAKVDNKSAKAWNGQLYTQLTRKKPAKKNGHLFNIASFVGASLSDPQNKLYEKVSFKKMGKDDINRQVKGGWAAMQEHYFLSAWVPEANQTHRYYSQVNKNQDLYTIGVMSPLKSIAPGQAGATSARLYVGPEVAARLEKVAPGLKMTVDYGFLWIIAVGLFWLMKHIYDIVGNWGWAIVLVTVLIKLVFYKLSATSYRSMAKMRDIQPKMNALRERYKDDKQALSQAMMEFYKKEKVNPFGGCLPILIQIPVFIALYWVLLESVELRQAPFILWIKDLAAPDPYYILPALMGLTMLIQQKISPAPPDPMQAKVMMILPVVFTFLFLRFPSGLVLYWVVNNALSILQQWYNMHKYDVDKAKARGKPLKK